MAINDAALATGHCTTYFSSIGAITPSFERIWAPLLLSGISTNRHRTISLGCVFNRFFVFNLGLRSQARSRMYAELLRCRLTEKIGLNGYGGSITAGSD
jgi:hypothetical protein